MAADDPLARAGLAALLDDESSVEVVGRTTLSDSSSAALEALQPDAIVIDSGWDPDVVVDALRELQALRLPLVFLLSDDTRAAEVYLEGGRVLLLRDASGGELAVAVAAAVQGLSVLAPALADAIVAPADASAGAVQGVLTRRELEVLRLVAEGRSNKGTAFDLDISDHTVKFHVNSILTKLGARSRTEAATTAARLGLLFL